MLLPMLLIAMKPCGCVWLPMKTKTFALALIQPLYQKEFLSISYYACVNSWQNKWQFDWHVSHA